MELNRLIEFLGYYFDNYSNITIFISSFLEMSPIGWLVPGGAALAIGGFFANGKDPSALMFLIFWGTMGSWLAFLLSYFLGKKSGMWLVKKLNQKKNAAFAKNLLENHGATILTTSMMANLTRFWISYIAGVESYKLTKFLTYSFVASFGWTLILVISGYVAGYERGNLEAAIGSIGIIGWIILALALFILQRSIRHEYKHFSKDVPYNE